MSIYSLLNWSVFFSFYVRSMHFMPIYGLEKCDSIILDAGMDNPLALMIDIILLLTS